MEIRRTVQFYCANQWDKKKRDKIARWNDWRNFASQVFIRTFSERNVFVTFENTQSTTATDVESGWKYNGRTTTQTCLGVRIGARVMFPGPWTNRVWTFLFVECSEWVSKFTNSVDCDDHNKCIHCFLCSKKFKKTVMSIRILWKAHFARERMHII